MINEILAYLLGALTVGLIEAGIIVKRIREQKDE